MINPFSILRLSIRESRKRPPHSDNCFSANLAGSYNLIVDKYTIKRSISQFSKVVISIRSFLQIFYHSITTKVVAINIQELETVIQNVSLYHSSITSETLHFIILLKNSTLFSFAFEKAYEIIE